ncbi:hypothetical protein PV325_004003 [Microctonus aethiopoides]|nr:hypothetical protein PV325_004003 [Microctonus aethiopoides]
MHLEHTDVVKAEVIKIEEKYQKAPVSVEDERKKTKPNRKSPLFQDQESANSRKMEVKEVRARNRAKIYLPYTKTERDLDLKKRSNEKDGESNGNIEVYMKVKVNISIKAQLS